MIQSLPVDHPLKHDPLCRLSIDNLPYATAILDSNLKYLMASQRWLSEMELENQDIVGRSLAAGIFHPSRQMKEACQNCLRSATETHVEEPIGRADGSNHWFRWNIRPWKTPSGELGGLILSVEDIIQRKQVETTLRESEAKLQAILITAQPSFI